MEKVIALSKLTSLLRTTEEKFAYRRAVKHTRQFSLGSCCCAPGLFLMDKSACTLAFKNRYLSPDVQQPSVLLRPQAC